MLTASGLAFIAGTFDQHLRAFDVESGKELWSAPLPAGAQALPMTYEIGGRQYVVIAAGGHDRLHSTMGDYVVAFALPGASAALRDTAVRRLDGDWVGEIHIGDARSGMSVSLRTVGDSMAAEARLDSVQITGPVTARRQGQAVTVSFPIFYPAKQNCTAVVTTTLELWNRGTLLEGGGSVNGACADHGHQNAAFVFRRRGG